MAQPKSAPAALLVYAAFSRHKQALEWLRLRIKQQRGEMALIGKPFAHDETTYYAAEMGEELRKQLIAVSGLYDPADLASTKLQSNAWETEFAELHDYSEKRPLNIDPGYVTLGKFVLASAKDRAHRIYLHSGIYAEECLYYVAGWQHRPWTYPDYLREDVLSFLNHARGLLKQEIQANALPRSEGQLSSGADADA